MQELVFTYEVQGGGTQVVRTVRLDGETAPQHSARHKEAVEQSKDDFPMKDQ